MKKIQTSPSYVNNNNNNNKRVKKKKKTGLENLENENDTLHSQASKRNLPHNQLFIIAFIATSFFVFVVSLYFALVLGITPSALLASSFNIENSEHTSPRLKTLYTIVDTPLKYMRWDIQRTEIACEIYRHETPIIINNSIVQQWPAMYKWTPSYLNTTIQHELINVYKNSQKVFN